MIGNFIDHHRARQGGGQRGGYRGGAVQKAGGEIEDDVGRSWGRGEFQGHQVGSRKEAGGIDGEAGGLTGGFRGDEDAIEITFHGSFQDAGQEQPGMGHGAAPGEGFTEEIGGAPSGEHGDRGRRSERVGPSPGRDRCPWVHISNCLPH